MNDLNPEHWHELERIASLGYAMSIDLRYEQGPFLGWLDTLVALGLLDFAEGDPAYNVYYSMTPAGISALEDYRKSHPPQE